ncbi:fatty acid amide hydrolase 1-like [Pollicipes pollicipes]|uniref:fatty acid amide hydrolase 1-like n=1 Tax=Pollicipes pollicipes TaxID=41117 RepID=UPI0018851DE8|nr:fatty acid amide hydrolase 1-like [Pollicipes pollicipes]
MHYFQSRASVLDRLPAAARGPLHGLPFSVKDCVDLEGYDSTAGLAKHLGQPASRSAPVVQTLIDLGGVPFCKTNVPQTMISFGCSNPVWGVTTNIYDGRCVGLRAVLPATFGGRSTTYAPQSAFSDA